MGPIAYSYDPKTKIFSGPVRAQECKIKIGQFYCPRFATFKKPPEMVEDRSLYFNIERDAWEYGPKPQPVAVVQKAPVEKGVEVRENVDLLKQVVANERMILGIELQKKVDQESRRVLDLVMALDAKIQALEMSLNLVRSMVSDSESKSQAALSIAESVDQRTVNHGEQIQNAFNVLNEKCDFVVREVESVKERVSGSEAPLKVDGSDLVASVAPKSKWKIWG